MKVKFFCLYLAIILILGGCGSQKSSGITTETEEYSQTVFAMDTAMTVTAYGSGCEEAVNAALEEIAHLDRIFSVTDENSDIYKINNEKSAQTDEETYSLISSALEFGEKTRGALNIAVYPAVKAWGFTTGEHRIPPDEELEELKKHISSENVVLNKDNTVTLTDTYGEIDLGSVAKGYTSARISEIFKEMGIESGILSLGGNVQTIGAKPDGSLWRVGISDPADESHFIGILELENKAAITSGSYQRYFEYEGVRYHHIIDPSTCAPARSGLTSVTIVSENGLLADAYSTAVFIMGLDKGSDFWRYNSEDFDAVFVTDNGEVYITEGLSQAFTPSEGITPSIIEKKQ